MFQLIFVHSNSGIFLFATASKVVLGPTQPLPNHWVPGAPSSRVKRPGREADRSHPSSAEVKNAWRYYTSTPQYVFMAWCLVKHRDNFTFTILRLAIVNFNMEAALTSETSVCYHKISQPWKPQNLASGWFSQYSDWLPAARPGFDSRERHRCSSSAPRPN
jgi:hypothetical protein